MSDSDKVKLAEKLKQARRRVAELETELMGDKEMMPLSDDLFRSFAESATDSISIWDSKLNLVYINDATLRCHPAGTKKADVVGKNIKELIPGCEKSGRYEKYSRVLKSGEPLILENFKADTKYGDIYLSTKVFKVGDGIGIISTDITERKRTEDALKQSEENFRRVFQSLGDIVIITDLTAKVIDVNETALRIGGYTKQEMLVDDGFKFIAERDREKAAKYMALAITQGSSEPEEYHMLCKDGRELVTEAKATVLHDGSGNPAGLICLLRDITERKRMEEDLRESQDRMSALVESAPDIIFSYDLNGKFLYGNKKVKDLLGYDPEELIGKSIAESGLLSEEGILKAIAKIDENRRGIVTGPDEYELIAKDGSRIYIDARGVPIVRGEKTEVLCIAHDITERKRMEEQLRQSEEKLHAIFESIGDSITVIDKAGKIIEVNEAAIKLFGCRSKGEALGTQALSFITEEDLPSAIAKLDEGKPARLITYRYKRMDGSFFWGETNSDVLCDNSGKIRGFIGIVRDITERMKAEEALRHSEEKFRVIFNSIADGISVIDLTTGNIIDTNQSALNMFNFAREDVIGHPAYELIAERDREKAMVDLQKTLKRGHSGLNEWCLVGRGGTEHDCEASSAVIRDKSGRPAYLVNVMRDISERKRMEEKLRQSEEKLRRIFESIGDAITIIDMNGKIIDANETAIRMSGGKREEHIGRYGLDLLAERDRERAVKDMTDAFSTGYSNAKEYTVVKKDGTEFPAETASTVLRDAAGAPVGIINILRDITERKQMEEKLQRSEEKIRQIFNSVGVGISVTDMEGKVAEVNDFGLRLCGCSKEEMIGHYGIRFIAERDRPRIIKEMRKTFETGKSGIYEFTSLKKDGTEYETETIVTVMHDSAGKPTGLIASVTDITERKRIERELNDYKANLETMVKERTADLARTNEQLRQEIAERESVQRDLHETDELLNAFFENAPDIIYMLDAQGKALYINKIAEELVGVSRKDIIGHNVFAVGVIPLNVIPLIQNGLKNLLNKEGLGRAEVDLVTISGEKLFLEAISFTTVRKGELTVIGIARDVTERRKSEAVLREKEALLRSFFNSPGLICGIVELEADDVRYITVNAAFADMYEVTPEAIANKLASEIGTDKNIVRLFIENYKRSRENDAPSYFEYQRGVDRKKRWLYVTVTFLGFEPNGNNARYAFVTTDITERRKAEEALRKNEGVLRSLLDATPAGVGLLVNRKMQKVNNALCNITGYTREELEGSDVSMLYPSDEEYLRIGKDLYAQMDKQGVGILEATLKHKNGEAVYVSLCLSPFDPNDRMAGVTATVLDITERKKAENALRESEEKLRILFRTVGLGITVTDLMGKIIDVNDALMKLSGFSSKEELIGRNGIDFISSNDRARATQALADVTATGIGTQEIFTLLRKDGSEYLCETSTTVMRDSSGKPAGLIIVQNDITERMRAEEALRESEEKYRGIFDESIATIYVFDAKKNFINTNQAGLDLLGYSREELLRMSIPDVDADPVVVLPAHQELLSGGRLINYEHKLRRKDGAIVSVLNNSMPLTDSQGNVVGMLSTLIDITERKQMEEELRESEERLRVFFENVPDILFAHNMEGQFTDINKKGLELSGYSRNEIIGKNILETGILPPDQLEGVISGIKDIENGKSGYPYEVQLVKKNGDRITVEAVSFPIKKRGRMEVMGIAHDITSRKAAEEALRASQEKLRAIFEAIEDGIAVADLEGKLIDMNESDIRLFGYERKEQLLNVNSFQFVTEADRPRVIKDMSEVLAIGSGKVDQYRLMDKNGTEFDAEVSGSLLRDNRGKPTAIVNIIRDITERKRMEEALKESEAKYRTLVEQSEQGICILQNGRIMFANKALAKMNGYSIKEMYAMSSDELLTTVHHEDRQDYIKRVRERMEGKKLRPKYEYRTIRKDGTEIWLETYSKTITYKGQPAIQSTIVDITERKQWENKLQESKEVLSFYLSQINQAQEEERKRIARELHDDTIQEIVALSRQLDNLIDKKIGPEEERRENRRLIEEAQRKVDTILKGIRRFTRDLRPSMLDDLGLVPALEWLTTDISQQFNIPIKISIRGKEQRTSSDVALAMYRIAQESLRNACRHSGANQIQVDLTYINKTVTLRITDNGQGFDPPKDTASLIRRGKLGVAGMYERAQLIGANLSIQSKRNKGTAVTLEVNIK